MFFYVWNKIVSLFTLNKTNPLIMPSVSTTYQYRDVNRKAFMMMIGFSEGTINIPNSDLGYRALVGGGVFDNYSDHPNKEIWIKRIGKYSSAAGKYQIEYGQWTPYIARLGLKDFSPIYQDLWCMNAFREINALDDIDAGRFESAVLKSGNRWASLPGSKFGQTIRTLEQVRDAYSKAGGRFAA